MATVERKPTVEFTLGEYLEVVTDGAERRFRCAKCGHDLGPTADNYKDHTLVREAPLQEAGPLIGDPKRFIDDEMVFRQYFCPGCVTLIENEVNRASEPPLRDIELH
jgi:N-methylhydantoinase B